MNTGVFDKIYLVGNGRIADDCLRILNRKDVSVTYIEVYNEPFSFTKKLCERLGIPFLHIEKKEMKCFLTGISEKTLILSVHNSYIFPSEAINKANLTILNMHIAPLPKYRGMNAPTWEIYEQEESAGVTWHEIAARIDSGRIIDQKVFPIGSDDTAMIVLQLSFHAGVELFEKNLDDFLNKTYKTRTAGDESTKLYLKKDLPNDGYLDVNWDFKKTYAFLRSMDYSGANLMRLPRVKKANKTYEITKYVKAANEEDVKARTEQWLDDRLVLSWNGGGIA